MKKVISFIKVTILGGILLLLPLFVLVMALAKAISMVHEVTTSVAHEVPFKVPGIGVATLLTTIIILLLCFIAGLFMYTGVAKRFKEFLEEDILVHIPGYSYLRALSTDQLADDHSTNWKPATIPVDGNELLCFVIDETEHYCSIFLPSAPTPSSGSICVREKGDVRYLPVDVLETIRLLKRFGRGSAAVLEKMSVETPPSRPL